MRGDKIKALRATMAGNAKGGQAARRMRRAHKAFAFICLRPKLAACKTLAEQNHVFGEAARYAKVVGLYSQTTYPSDIATGLRNLIKRGPGGMPELPKENFIQEELSWDR